MAVRHSGTTTLTGDVGGPVTVTTGQHLCLDGSRLAGTLTVQPGGALTVTR